MKKIVPMAFLLFAAIGCGPNAKIVKFDTWPEAPFLGDSVTLYWEVQNATEVMLDNKPVSAIGETRVLLDRSKDFILSAKGSNSEASKKLEIVAQPK